MTDTRKSLDHERESQVAPPVRSGEFTPGPWVSQLDEANDIRFVVAGAWPYGSTICEMNEEEQPREGSCEANARLIAAAPDMLAALAWLIAMVDQPSMERDPDDYADQLLLARKAARAAIAKATMTAPQSEQSPLPRETGAAS